MRVLITGARGMLGQAVAQAFAHHEVTALGRSELDISDEAAVEAAVAGHDLVINCAAYTAVDDAETDEAAALAVNAAGPTHLAAAALRHGAVLVHYSTDYVFDGTASEPYAEDAPLRPASAYGRTKAAGEAAIREVLPAHYIIRTAWLYGAGGKNFALTMATLERSRDELQVVDDQVGQPTYTADLAEQTRVLIDAHAPFGTYHGTNSGRASWFEFAREIFRLVGADPERVKPTDSSTYQRPAQRPAFSVLGHDAWNAAGLAPMRDWREALAAAHAAGALEVR